MICVKDSIFKEHLYVLRSIYDSQMPLFSQHQIFNRYLSMVLVQIRH